MKKIHTRRKRKHGLSTKKRHYRYFHATIRKKRPRTFFSEEQAHNWAKNIGLEKDKYEVLLTKHNRKFKIVTK
ncbi:MAG: hypothetical protein QXG00_03145 [Candidatus Woesearchaeota archaeon]